MESDIFGPFQEQISGSISSICTSRMFISITLTLVDLSNDQLSEEVPNCWDLFSQSQDILNLANNNFSGKIPASMGSLYNIEALQLHHNKFSGELPETLNKCSKLKVLDLGGHEFSGLIPEWMGMVISLRANFFSRTAPSCHLQLIQLFDLSGNSISGSIPKCLNNLTALTKRDEYSNPTIKISYTSGLGSQNFVAESSLN